MRTKVAAEKHWCVQSLEESRAYRIDVNVHVFARLWRVTFHKSGVVVPAAAADWGQERETRRTHAGHLPDSFQHFLAELGRPLTLISCLRGIESEQQDVVTAETRVECFEVAQRAHQQASANDEHHREGNLSNHQRAAQDSSTPGVCQVSRACPDGWAAAPSSRPKRRCKPEGNSGDQCDEQCEPEDIEIRMNIKSHTAPAACHQRDE